MKHKKMVHKKAHRSMAQKRASIANIKKAQKAKRK